MSEHDEQAALIQWRDWMRVRDERIGMLLAIPNGGARHKAVAARLKAEGATAGVPDLCLPVAASGYGALWIELKTATGRVQPTQSEWIERLNRHGQCAVIARGWQEAARQIAAYLGIEPNEVGL